MAEKQLHELVLEEMEKRVGNIAQILGYFEHQVDLQGKIIQLLAKQTSNLTPELQALLEWNDSIIAKSSVDFDNLTSPYEGYKLPSVITTKSAMRDIQNVYLKVKLSEQ